MAGFSLLDATANTLDIQIAPSGTATASFKPVIASAEYESSRSMQDRTTLDGGKWVNELPSRNQDFLRINRFASQGSNISDLSGLMTASTPTNVVVTLATGCTKTGTFFCTRETFSIVATSVGIPGTAEFRSAAPVATAWVTA